MNAASKDIADLLAGESSLGLVFAENLFTARQPDAPSDCVTIYDRPNKQPMLTMSKAESRYYFSGVVVRVRNIDFSAAWALSFQILQFLHGTSQVTVNGTSYQLIQALSDPQLLEWDENNRAVVITSYDIQRK